MLVLGLFFTEFLLRLLGLSETVVAQVAPYMRVQLMGMATQSFQRKAPAMSGTTRPCAPR